MHGEKVNRMRWIPRKLLSQLQNVVVDCAGAEVGVVSPDFIQQFVSRDNSFWILHEKCKRLELQGGECNRPVGATDFHPGEINANLSEPNLSAVSSRIRIANSRTDANHEFPPG